MLFITGDCHGDIDIKKLTVAQFAIQKELTKNDIVIVMGDWGAIWYGNRKDNYMLNWWDNKPWTTFVVLGNHENWNAIEQLPITDKFDNIVYQAGKSVFLAHSGLIYNLMDRKCLVVNGADSHDKEWRKEGISWWPQEQITEADYRRAAASLEKVDNKIDYLFTHTGGSTIAAALGFNPTPSDKWLDKVMDKIENYDYTHYCGHYHVDRILSRNSRILYNDIVLIEE